MIELARYRDNPDAMSGRRLDGLTDRALGLVMSYVNRKLLLRHPDVGGALSLAIAGEIQLRKGTVSKSAGFVAPVLAIEDLPQVISSLSGYANATWERGIRIFIVHVIGDLVGVAERARESSPANVNFQGRKSQRGNRGAGCAGEVGCDSDNLADGEKRC